MRGIVLAGGTGSRLWPITQAVSKQLLPVYDKPMIYYALSSLMLAGLREIAIITTPNDAKAFSSLLGSGEKWGIKLSYLTQAKPDGIASAYLIGEEFLNGDSSALVLGDNLFVGAGLGMSLSRQVSLKAGAQIFGYLVSNPTQYGNIEFGQDGNIVKIEEKPTTPLSNWAVPGIYFADGTAPQKAKQIVPSSRGEREIIDLLKMYLSEQNLRVETLPRGSVWLDMGNPSDLASASEYVQIIEVRQGFKISCPEEIAWRNGWIDDNLLMEAAFFYQGSSYGKYLRSLVSSENYSTNFPEKN